MWRKAEEWNIDRYGRIDRMTALAETNKMSAISGSQRKQDGDGLELTTKEAIIAYAL